MWNDETFRQLTAPQPNAQTLWQRFLTGPELTNIPGCFQAWDAGLAKALRWSPEGFAKAYEECFRHGLVKADWDVGFVYVPKALHHNRPENPNVVKSWKTTWDLLPECALKRQAYQEIKAFLKGLGKGYAEAFEDGCLDHCPNQEQEQEQEQEEKDPPTPKPKSDKPRDPLADSLRRGPTCERPDVKRVHSAWQTLFGLTGHTFQGWGDRDADALAAALDKHGEETCMLVLKRSPMDGMVSGRDDEKKFKHTSLAYIFGNANAFARILRDAKANDQSNQESTTERFARLKKLQAGGA